MFNIDGLQPFRRQVEHFLTDMSNRVEHQKLNQTTAELSFGWVFGVQLGLRQTQELIKMRTIRRGKVPPAILLFSCKLLLKSNKAVGTFLFLIVLVLISACVYRRPSWTPKTQPNCSVWLSFWCSTRFTGKLGSLRSRLVGRCGTPKERITAI